MKTLFIHIGTPKTGTTAIQTFLTNNSEVLEKKGFCYPRATKKYPMVSLRRNGHFLSGHVQGVKPDIEENKHIIKCGMQNVKKLFEVYDNVILSDESIWQASSYAHKFLWKMLSRIAERDGYIIKVIVYLRRQDDYIMSIWNQMVKYSGETKTWDEYFKKRENSKVFMYYEKLQEIEEYFGKENIIVRRFDRKSFLNQSIFDDFLDAIGLEMTDEFVVVKSDPNPRLLGNCHEFQRVLNNMDNITSDDKKCISGMLKRCPSKAIEKYKYSMMSKTEREDFLKKFRAGNEMVAVKYIGDGKPMYDYNVPDLPKWSKNNPYFSTDVEWFNGLLDTMLKKNRNGIFALKKEAMLYNRIMRLAKSFKGFFIGAKS